MAASFNECIFVGRLGSDPDFNVTPSGTPVSKFSLAVDKYQGKDEKKEPLWLRVVAWNKLAETVEKYLEKGRLVLVQGRLDIDSYTDKEGVRRQSIQIIANSVQMLGGKPQQNGATKSASSSEDFDPFLDDDTLP